MKETFYDLRCPVKIAVLADFHNGEGAPIVSSLERNEPDMIAIVGDIIYGGYNPCEVVYVC